MWILGCAITFRNFLFRYGYSSVVTFGGCQEDFMLVVHTPEEDSAHHPPGTHKLLLCMNKPKVIFKICLNCVWLCMLSRQTANIVIYVKKYFLFHISSCGARGNYDLRNMCGNFPDHKSLTEAKARFLAPILRPCHVKATFYLMYQFSRCLLLPLQSSQWPPV